MQTLPALEQTLWRRETRFDRALMEATFAPGFFEFGRSGRRYTRAELIFDEAQASDIPATLHRLTVTPPLGQARPRDLHLRTPQRPARMGQPRLGLGQVHGPLAAALPPGHPLRGPR